MSLQSDCLSVIIAGVVVGLLIARADTHEKDAKGRNRGSKDRAACFSRSPDCEGGAEPYVSWLTGLKWGVRG